MFCILGSENGCGHLNWIFDGFYRHLLLPLWSHFMVCTSKVKTRQKGLQNNSGPMWSKLTSVYCFSLRLLFLFAFICAETYLVTTRSYIALLLTAADRCKNFAGSIFSANLVFRGNAIGDQSVLVDWKNRSAVENKANLALSRDGIFDWNRRKKELTSKKVHCILTVNMVSATTACSRVHRPFVQNCCFSNFSTQRFGLHQHYQPLVA